MLVGPRSLLLPLISGVFTILFLAFLPSSLPGPDASSFRLLLPLISGVLRFIFVALFGFWEEIAIGETLGLGYELIHPSIRCFWRKKEKAKLNFSASFPHPTPPFSPRTIAQIVHIFQSTTDVFVRFFLGDSNCFRAVGTIFFLTS